MLVDGDFMEVNALGAQEPTEGLIEVFLVVNFGKLLASCRSVGIKGLLLRPDYFLFSSRLRGLRH